jgi:hypothetical protein
MASKAVAGVLIKTAEAHPTGIQGSRISALVATEVKAELKRESEKRQGQAARRTTSTCQLPNTGPKEEDEKGITKTTTKHRLVMPS